MVLPFGLPDLSSMLLQALSMWWRVMVFRSGFILSQLQASVEGEILWTYSFNTKLQMNLIGWVWVMGLSLNQSLWP